MPKQSPPPSYPLDGGGNENKLKKVVPSIRGGLLWRVPGGTSIIT